MNQNSNPTKFYKPKTGPKYNHTNFIEALKSSGSSIVKDTARGITHDLVGGVASGVVDSFTGSNSQASQQPENDFNFAEYLKSSERTTKQQNIVKYEYEQQETIIFNRRQQEVDQKIKQIQDELQKLAKEIVHLDQATQAAIIQEIKNPGQYHLNFFEKLLHFLRQMRKRVIESRNWAALQQRRSSHKSYFWHQSNQKVSGTKFMLSQERTLATQTG